MINQAVLIDWKQQAELKFFLSAIQFQRIKQDLRKIKNFSSDGCTGVPDFIFFPCCRDHDYEYSPWGRVSRWIADLRFFKCMKELLEQEEWTDWWEEFLPYIYFAGVRLFGWTRYSKDKKNG